MALTKIQIIEKLSSRYNNVVRNNFTWANLTSIVGGATVETKQEIVNAIKNKHSNEVGMILMRLVDDWIKVKSMAEIDGKIVNDRITIADLGSFLE